MTILPAKRILKHNQLQTKLNLNSMNLNLRDWSALGFIYLSSDSRDYAAEKHSTSYLCKTSIILGGGLVERRGWVNSQCQGVQLVWMIVGQGPFALAVGAGGGLFGLFSLIYLFSFFSPSLWETVR